MNKIMIYFTFDDFCNGIYSSILPSIPHDDGGGDWFKDILNTLELSYNVSTLSSTYQISDIQAIVSQLMWNVYNRHKNDYCYWRQNYSETNYNLTTSDYKEFFIKLLNVLDLTLPKYLPLFIQNKEYSSNPVAPIKSESKGRTRFNDTPQTEFVDEEEINDESHATNVSESSSESSVDTGSIVERLDEAFKNWRSIILEWSNEFNQCFLKEEQIVW